MRGVVIYHPDYAEHETGPAHPETAARAQWVMDALQGSPHAAQWPVIAPAPAPTRWIEAVHAPEYLRFVEESCLSGHSTLDFGETLIGPESYRIARLAAGGALRAVDAVLSGEAPVAFSVARPPGHHARPEQAMGFCIFNHIAIAARYAEVHYGVERVAILDWDVHHGNGTQEVFYESPSVFFASLHQWPLYPHTGGQDETGYGPGQGLTLNVPLPAHTDGPAFREAFRTRLEPALEHFRPDLILLSAGFDAHRLDPLAELDLETADFHALARQVRQWADGLCAGRVVSILEGGYHPQAMPASALAHWEGLCGLPPV